MEGYKNYKNANPLILVAYLYNDHKEEVRTLRRLSYRQRD